MTDLLTIVCSYYCKAYSELSTKFVHLGVLDMKKILTLVLLALLSLSFIAEAANRKGSHRVGGTNSHGKGSHYVGGHK
jgi:hypothetical protein